MGKGEIGMREAEQPKRLKGFELYCEKCDWKLSVPVAEVSSWHNRLCPKCGKDVIVKDSDMVVLADIVSERVGRKDS